MIQAAVPSAVTFTLSAPLPVLVTALALLMSTTTLEYSPWYRDPPFSPHQRKSLVRYLALSLVV